MALCAPESDGSKTKRRSGGTERRPGRTERRSDDGGGVNLDRQSVTLGVRVALSKPEGAFTKRNVALSNPDVAFTKARARLRSSATLSRFIGRDYRSQEPLLPRKGARSHPERLFFDEKERLSVPEGTFTIHMQQVETKTNVHEQRKTKSKWLLLQRAVPDADGVHDDFCCTFQ